MLCIYFNWRSLENSSKTSNAGNHDGYFTRNDKHLVQKQSKKVLVRSVLVVLYLRVDVTLRQSSDNQSNDKKYINISESFKVKGKTDFPPLVEE